MQTPESLVWELAVWFMTLKRCIVALNAMVTHGYCKIPFFLAGMSIPSLGTYGWGGGDRKMLPSYNLFPFSAAKSKAKYEKRKGSPYFQKHNPPLGCISGLKS